MNERPVGDRLNVSGDKSDADSSGRCATDTDSESIYHRFIIAHNRAPRHFGHPERYDAYRRLLNPLCGDEMEVFLHRRMKKDIERVDFAGESCAIATASASLMTSAVENLSCQKALELCHYVLAALAAPPATSAVPEVLAPLAEVRRFPGRLDCARLPWKALLEILSAPPDSACTSGDRQSAHRMTQG